MMTDDKRLLREVFAVCEATEDKFADSEDNFSRGRAFEAKHIRRGIGTWYQDQFCGRSFMGEPAIDLERENKRLLDEVRKCRSVLQSIAEMTNSENPDSYRTDDPEGCLCAVFATATAAVTPPSPPDPTP